MQIVRFCISFVSFEEASFGIFCRIAEQEAPEIDFTSRLKCVYNQVSYIHAARRNNFQKYLHGKEA